jgi:hypothetical protein
VQHRGPPWSQLGVFQATVRDTVGHSHDGGSNHRTIDNNHTNVIATDMVLQQHWTSIEQGSVEMDWQERSVPSSRQRFDDHLPGCGSRERKCLLSIMGDDGSWCGHPCPLPATQLGHFLVVDAVAGRRVDVNAIGLPRSKHPPRKTLNLCMIGDAAVPLRCGEHRLGGKQLCGPSRHGPGPHNGCRRSKLLGAPG